jgi:hypothetical protein
VDLRYLDKVQDELGRDGAPLFVVEPGPWRDSQVVCQSFHLLSKLLFADLVDPLCQRKLNDSIRGAFYEILIRGVLDSFARCPIAGSDGKEAIVTTQISRADPNHFSSGFPP